MRIGKLRHRVRLERPSRTQDPATGEMIDGWELVDTLWASIEPLSAREFIAAMSTQSEVTARILIRHRDGESGLLDRRYTFFGHEDQKQCPDKRQKCDKS